MFDFEISYLIVTSSSEYGITVWGNDTKTYRSTILFVLDLTTSYSVVNWRDTYISQSDAYMTYAKRQDKTIYWYCANSTKSDSGYQGFNIINRTYKYIAFSN